MRKGDGSGELKRMGPGHRISCTYGYLGLVAAPVSVGPAAERYERHPLGRREGLQPVSSLEEGMPCPRLRPHLFPKTGMLNDLVATARLSNDPISYGARLFDTFWIDWSIPD